MTIILEKKEYPLSCTLGVVKKIEEVFKKDFLSLIISFDKMTIKDKVKFLYQGIKDMEETQFEKIIEHGWGYVQLNEKLKEFILQLQYPGESQKEIQKKITKALAQENLFLNGEN